MFSGACLCMCCGACVVHVCVSGACMCKVYPIFYGVYDWWCMGCMCYICVYFVHTCVHSA